MQKPQDSLGVKFVCYFGEDVERSISCFTKLILEELIQSSTFCNSPEELLDWLICASLNRMRCQPPHLLTLVSQKGWDYDSVTPLHLLFKHFFFFVQFIFFKKSVKYVFQLYAMNQLEYLIWFSRCHPIKYSPLFHLFDYKFQWPNLLVNLS